MNQRQKLKKLKRDNKVMKDVINASPELKSMYSAIQKPIEVVYTTVQCRELRCERMVSPGNPYDAGIISLYKNAMADNLAEQFKEFITYKVTGDSAYPFIEASVFVGRGKE